MNLKMLVQSMTDSKAQVLLAFLFARCALDTREIQAWTGLKRETIYRTVDSLEAMGLIAHQVLAHGRKIFLPAGDLLPFFQMSAERTPELQESAERTSGLQMSTNRTPDVVDVEINSSLSSITTTTTLTGQMSTKRTSEELAALKTALDEFSIMGKKRAQLIACEWVSADYVRAHCERASGEQWDNPVGMAITRMLEQLPASEKSNGRKRGKMIDTNDPAERAKYVSGKYADFIEH